MEEVPYFSYIYKKNVAKEIKNNMIIKNDQKSVQGFIVEH